MVIQLNNLHDILDFINPNNNFKLNYPIITHHPRNNIDYNFPSELYYDTEPSQTIQKYEISHSNLPHVNIIHQRHKISMGKIVDHSNEIGKYSISLLIRNNGNIALDDLQIVDTLPLDAEIFNAY